MKGRWASAWLWALRRLGADPGAPSGDTGRWPSTWQAFLWDLAPGDVAPGSDGVNSPSWTPPEWVESVPEASLQDHLTLERQRHRDAQDVAASIELKASRLMTPMVALVTGAVALGAFELKALRQSASTWQAVWPLVGSVACAIAVIQLLIAIIRALDADTRMGIYKRADPTVEITGGREALAAESLRTAVASWTGGKKATRLLWARAAFSRSILWLCVAMVFGGVSILLPGARVATSGSSQLQDPGPTMTNSPSLTSTTQTSTPTGSSQPTTAKPPR